MEAEPETKLIERQTPLEGEPVQMPEAPIVGQMVGRFELVHRLGHGGMAAVYLGRATGRAGFEKLVAVKVIHPHLAAEPEFVEMFLDEARIAARLQHPHVVEIHDLGEGDGVFFMVMEYVEGETLASLLRQLRKHDQRLPLPAVLQMVADACEGLAAAHDLTDPDGRPMHLVHRDVSPHNLLVGMDGRVKVVDFGIAKATGRRSSTRTGQLRGKLAYMSPEQAGGDAIDHRTDLFALGAVLWELLTNGRLFVADTESETIARVSACEVPDLRERRANLPDNVVALVERALARDPDERFASAHEMLRELRTVLRSLEGEGDPELEPREQIAAVMEQLFSARMRYIRAAVRRASRTGTGSRPVAAANDPLSSSELTRSTGRSDLSSSSGSRFRPSTSSQPVVAAATNTHTFTSSIATAPARHWSLWLLLPLVGAAVGAAMVSGGLGRGPAPSDAAPEATAAPREPAPAPVEPGPPVPSTIKWHFDTEPSGAIVTLDGEALAERSPVMVELPRGEEAVRVEVSKDGYRPIRWHLAPLVSDNFSYRLEAVPAASDEGLDGGRHKLRGGRLRSKPKPKPKPEPKPKPDSQDTTPTAPAGDGGDELPPMPDFTKAGGGKTRTR